MSLFKWESPLASADSLPLSESECYLLLDNDLIDINGDLLRSFPKLEPALLGQPPAEHYASDDSSTGFLYPPSPVDCKPSRAQLASDILRQLDTECKQESFPNWLEEKVELPIFEHIPAAPERDVPLHLTCPAPAAVPVYAAPKGDTAELLREFETMYNAVELTHLTPPQSPPGPATQLLLSYAQHAVQVSPVVPAAPPAPPALPVWPTVPQQPTDLDREMAVVEELMRHSAAHHLSTHEPSPPHSSDYSSPPSSPHSSSSSSSADEEWERAPRSTSRPKPYSRNTDDRRSRKKEQNKNAATRYRQKKKAEIEVLLSEENGLRMRHGELDTKCADLQREIRYLKGLMRDLFKAKGLIK